MSRRSSVRPAPGRMSLSQVSLHFAVATLALTAVIAMFAQGRDGASAPGSAQGAQSGEDAIDRAARGTKPSPIRIAQPRSATGSFGEAAGGDAIRHTAFASMGDVLDDFPAPLAALGDGTDPAFRLPRGMDLEQWLALHAAPQDGEMPTTGAPMSEQQFTDMLAQSRERSGTATGSD